MLVSPCLLPDYRNFFLRSRLRKQRDSQSATRFSSYLRHKRGSLCQVFLAETVETGTKNHCVIGATHHAYLAKKTWERLNLELLRNVSVHEFYRLKPLITLEQVNTTEWSKK